MSAVAAFLAGMAVGAVLLIAIGSALAAWIVDALHRASNGDLDEEIHQ